MKKIILTLIAAVGLVTGAAHAAGADTIAWTRRPTRPTTWPAAKRRQDLRQLLPRLPLCCVHAFNRLRDIGLTEQQIKDNLPFTTDKVGETMKASIDLGRPRNGLAPTRPDLTVIARSRAGHGGTGADYLYTFLRTFYRDDTKATGWNNLAFQRGHAPCAVANARRTSSRV